jgi:hypothetical protein
MVRAAESRVERVPRRRGMHDKEKSTWMHPRFVLSF